jgi:hypothetical protein
MDRTTEVKAAKRTATDALREMEIIVPSIGIVVWIATFVLTPGSGWMRFSIANVGISIVFVLAAFVNIVRIARIPKR